MELDRLAVQLRLRNPWEAMDLGFAMARAWMPQVYGAWLALALPVFALALLVLPPQWAAMLLWWLKPALDRIVLHVLAGGVFGDLPRVGAALRALPHALTPGLLAALTWLRFAPTRSFDLAVWQLERQRGRAARSRREQLRRRVGGNAVWLTAVCLHFELALGLSVMALYDLFLPATDAQSVGLFQLFYGSSPWTAQWATALTYFAVVSVLEPAYVAAGFALYLNRRTALEGWDLELALRRIGQRLSRSAPEAPQPAPAAAEPAVPAVIPSGAALVLACGLAAVLALAPTASWAQDAPGAARDPAVEVKKVYERPELDAYEQRTVLEYLGPKQGKRERRQQRWWWADVLGIAAGEIVRILAWAAVGLALVFVLYYLLRRYAFLAARQGIVAPPPATLFGLDVRPESLPDDVAAAAALLARAGRLREALSLLYRGALATLLHRDRVALTGGDTEVDCLRKSRARVPAPVHAYLAGLLAAWQRAAYAGRPVSREEVETLCSAWPLHFADARTATGAAQ